MNCICVTHLSLRLLVVSLRQEETCIKYKFSLVCHFKKKKNEEVFLTTFNRDVTSLYQNSET